MDRNYFDIRMFVCKHAEDFVCARLSNFIKTRAHEKGLRKLIDPRQYPLCLRSRYELIRSISCQFHWNNRLVESIRTFHTELGENFLRGTRCMVADTQEHAGSGVVVRRGIEEPVVVALVIVRKVG